MEAVTDTSDRTEHTVELSTVIGSQYALTWGQFAVCAAFSGLYLLLSYLPLFHAITWRHVESGGWIVAHKSLPNVDPTLPLSDGFRSVSSSWLSDVLLNQLFQFAGLQGLSSALAVVFVSLMVLTCWVFQRRSGHLSLAIIATGVVLALHWPRIAILRPEWLGLISFMLLLGIVSNSDSRATSSPRWWSIAALFLVWSNLDGSVVLGVIVLAGLALAEVIESVSRSRKFSDILSDRGLQHSVYQIELAALASLCQPLGAQLWIDFASSTRASFWWTLGGYSPLVMISAAGGTVLGIWILTGLLLRCSHRPVRAADVILFSLASLAVVVNQQATLWGVPLMLFVLLPHLSEVIHRAGWLPEKRSQPAFTEGESAPPLAFAFSLLSLLVMWSAFVLSPLANPLFGGRARPLERMVSNQAPLGVTKYLGNLSAAPIGLAWVPAEWGDWLSLVSPEGLKISSNSQLQLLTERQLFDIVQVSRGDGNWTRTLDRYGVEWLVVDKEHQPRLFDAALVEGDNWSIRYEDAQALVLRRKT